MSMSQIFRLALIADLQKMPGGILHACVGMTALNHQSDPSILLFYWQCTTESTVYTCRIQQTAYNPCMMDLDQLTTKKARHHITIYPKNMLKPTTQANRSLRSRANRARGPLGWTLLAGATQRRKRILPEETGSLPNSMKSFGGTPLVFSIPCRLFLLERH